MTYKMTVVWKLICAFVYLFNVPFLFALPWLLCVVSQLQDIVEQEDGKEVVSPPILQLSAEKMTRYGIMLMDYGLVRPPC